MKFSIADMLHMRTLRCFRPALRPYIPSKYRVAYLRFYSAQPSEIVPRIRTWSTDGPEKYQHEDQYPRIKKEDAAINYHTFKERYRSLARGESKPEDEVVVRGMSAYQLEVDMAHAVKEEYGHCGSQDQSWGSSTFFKTVDVCSWTPIDYNACSTIPVYQIPV